MFATLRGTTFVSSNLIDKKARGIGLDMKKFLDDDQSTADIVLVVEDEEGNRLEKPAHRFILAARSRVFKSMFYGGFDAIDKEVLLPEVRDSRILDRLLKYIYTDTAELTNDTVLSLLAIANQYDLPRLKKACGSFAAENINNENVHQIFEFAVIYNEEVLQNECVKFIGKEIDELIEGKKLLNMSPDMFAALIANDSLPLDEDRVLQLAREWCDSHEEVAEAESIDLAAIFKGVRLPMVALKTLMEVKKLKYVPVDDYIEALEYSVLPQLFEEQVAKETRFNPRGFKMGGFFSMMRFQNPPDAIIMSPDCLSVSNTLDSVVKSVLTTLEMTQNKLYYFEVEVKNGKTTSDMMIGVCDKATHSPTSFMSHNARGWALYTNGGSIYHNSGSATYGDASVPTNSTVGCVVDFTSGVGSMYFIVNGESWGLAYNNITKPVMAAVTLYHSGDQIKINRHARLRLKDFKTKRSRI